LGRSGGSQFSKSDDDDDDDDDDALLWLVLPFSIICHLLSICASEIPLGASAVGFLVLRGGKPARVMAATYGLPGSEDDGEYDDELEAQNVNVDLVVENARVGMAEDQEREGELGYDEEGVGRELFGDDDEGGRKEEEFDMDIRGGEDEVKEQWQEQEEEKEQGCVESFEQIEDTEIEIEIDFGEGVEQEQRENVDGAGQEGEEEVEEEEGLLTEKSEEQAEEGKEDENADIDEEDLFGEETELQTEENAAQAEYQVAEEEDTSLDDLFGEDMDEQAHEGAEHTELEARDQELEEHEVSQTAEMQTQQQHAGQDTPLVEQTEEQMVIDLDEDSKANEEEEMDPNLNPEPEAIRDENIESTTVEVATPSHSISPMISPDEVNLMVAAEMKALEEEDTRSKVAKLEESNAIIARENAMLSDENDRLQAENAQLEAANTALQISHQEDMKRSRGGITNLEKRIKELLEERDEMKGELKRNDERLQEMIAILRTDRELLEHEVKKWTGKFYHLEREFQNSMSTHKQDLDDQKNTITALRETIANSSDKDLEIAILNNELRILREQASSKTPESSIPGLDIGPLEEEVSRQARANDQLRSENANLKEWITTLEASGTPSADTQKLQSEMNRLQAENASLKEDISKAEAWAEEMENSGPQEDNCVVIEGLKEELKTAVVEKNNADFEVQHLADVVENREREIEVLVEQRDRAKSDLQDISTAMVQLDAQHQAVIAELSGLKLASETNKRYARGEIIRLKRFFQKIEDERVLSEAEGSAFWALYELEEALAGPHMVLPLVDVKAAAESPDADVQTDRPSMQEPGPDVSAICAELADYIDMNEASKAKIARLEEQLALISVETGRVRHTTTPEPFKPLTPGHSPEQLFDLQAKNAQLKSRIDTLRREHEAAMDYHEELVAQVQRENLESHATILNLSDELITYKPLINSSDLETGGNSAEVILNLTQQVKAMEKDLALYTVTPASTRETSPHRDAIVNRLQEENKVLSQQTAELQTEVASLQITLTKIPQDQRDLYGATLPLSPSFIRASTSSSPSTDFRLTASEIWKLPRSMIEALQARIRTLESEVQTLWENTQNFMVLVDNMQPLRPHIRKPAHLTLDNARLDNFRTWARNEGYEALMGSYAEEIDLDTLAPSVPAAPPNTAATPRFSELEREDRHGREGTPSPDSPEFRFRRLSFREVPAGQLADYQGVETASIAATAESATRGSPPVPGDWFLDPPKRGRGQSKSLWSWPDSWPLDLNDPPKSKSRKKSWGFEGISPFEKRFGLTTIGREEGKEKAKDEMQWPDDMKRPAVGESTSWEQYSPELDAAAFPSGKPKSKPKAQTKSKKRKRDDDTKYKDTGASDSDSLSDAEISSLFLQDEIATELISSTGKAAHDDKKIKKGKDKSDKDNLGRIGKVTKIMKKVVVRRKKPVREPVNIEEELEEDLETPNPFGPDGRYPSRKRRKVRKFIP
jgi:hypothetical protein